MTREDALAIASSALRTLKVAAELLAGAFPAAPEIVFINDLPLEVQRALGEMEGSAPHVQHMDMGERHGTIEAIDLRLHGVRVRSQVFRDVTLAEAQLAASSCIRCALAAGLCGSDQRIDAAADRARLKRSEPTQIFTRDAAGIVSEQTVVLL